MINFLQKLWAKILLWALVRLNQEPVKLKNEISPRYSRQDVIKICQAQFPNGSHYVEAHQYENGALGVRGSVFAIGYFPISVWWPAAGEREGRLEIVRRVRSRWERAKMLNPTGKART